MTPALICLALTVYYEARSEPMTGQIAVAQVVLNRVEHAAYPATICEVVHQGGTYRHRCQFSYWCDGKPETPSDYRAWRLAKVIAQLTHDGVITGDVNDATHYHADYSLPSWRIQMHLVATIGRHVFYLCDERCSVPPRRS